MTPEGPLAYVAGYVNQTLYRKSKNSKEADSLRNQEIQMFYYFHVPRGGLWAPNSWLLKIAEITELFSRKQTKFGKPTLSPVGDVITSRLAKSLWNNIIDRCNIDISRECQCFMF